MSSGYRIEAGLAVLDFVDTLSATEGDRLPDRATLARWIVDAGVHPAAAGPSPSDLDDARRTRVLLRGVLESARSGDRLHGDAVAAINRLASASPPPVALTAERERRTPACTVEQALGVLAREAIELFTDPHRLALVGQCQGAGCDALFLDTSRGRRRRWCSSEICGNRARVSRSRAPR